MRILNLILLFAYLMSCSENQTVNQPEEIEFGASYRFITTSNMPSINNGILITKVAYSGCNGNHEFELKNRKVNSTAEIWLFKHAEDQLCEAYFEEEKKYTLSESILKSKKIVLITPNEERISLK